MKPVRTSLTVGFADGAVPECFRSYCGQYSRAIPAVAEFPYENGQFDIVLMDAAAVSRQSAKEAHRVLRADGRLIFRVPERTKKQAGFTLPEIYSVVREGFNIVDIERQPWWLFGLRGRTITICAQKKNWRAVTNSYRPLV